MDLVACVTGVPLIGISFSYGRDQRLARGYNQSELSMRDPRQGPGWFFHDPAIYDVNEISANPRSQKNASGYRMPGTHFA